MIHRAASAVDTGERAAVAYFLFKMPGLDKGASTNQIQEKLREFWTLLGKPAEFPFYVVEIEIAPTDVYERVRVIASAGEKNKEAISEAVSAVLLGEDPLFEFNISNPVKIRSS